MTRPDYQPLLDDCTAKLAREQKRANRISWTRLAVFLLTVACAVPGFQHTQWAGPLALLLGTAVFCVLVRRLNRVQADIRFLQARGEVLEAYLARLGDGWRTFPDTGEEFLGEDAPARDLNLFGKDSLYQFLCAAKSPNGRKVLADRLLNRMPSVPEILPRQRAVQELSEDWDFLLELQTLSAQLPAEKRGEGQRSIEDFQKLAAEPRPKTPLALTILIWLLPCVTLFTLVSAVLQIRTELSLALCSCLVCLQLLITFLGFLRNQKLLAPLYAFCQGISAYRAIFALAERQTFQCPYLQSLREKLTGGSLPATQALRRLERIGEAVKLRHSGLMLLLLNGLLLWDYHCADRFLDWQAVCGRDVEGWMKAVGELESLSSLAVLCYVRADSAFPNLVEQEKPTISFAGLRHPLIPEQAAVGNDFQLTGSTCIITGSNMSGKTTFLRTIGVNLVLAYAGGPVTARDFTCSQMALFTSMRIEDSVTQGVSTFYAELLRIKEIVDYSKRGLPMMALIDEIYKGTNSRDRITGAQETLRRLSGPHALVLVTTHDFELCSLGEEKSGFGFTLVNFHFTEHYVNNEIRFDYKLRPGRCQTTNARQLLRMVGIIE